MAVVAGELEALPGTRHVGLIEAGRSGSVVTADVRANAADAALATLDGLGVPPDDVALVRLETVVPVSAEPLALVWADVLGQASARARAPGLYLFLMSVAGVIAGLGVINKSSILVVGAMATSPTCSRSPLPASASCWGGGRSSSAGCGRCCSG